MWFVARGKGGLLLGAKIVCLLGAKVERRKGGKMTVLRPDLVIILFAIFVALLCSQQVTTTWSTESLMWLISGCGDCSPS